MRWRRRESPTTDSTGVVPRRRLRGRPAPRPLGSIGCRAACPHVDVLPQATTRSAPPSVGASAWQSPGTPVTTSPSTALCHGRHRQQRASRRPARSRGPRPIGLAVAPRPRLTPSASLAEASSSRATSGGGLRAAGCCVLGGSAAWPSGIACSRAAGRRWSALPGDPLRHASAASATAPQRTRLKPRPPTPPASRSIISSARAGRLRVHTTSGVRLLAPRRCRHRVSSLPSPDGQTARQSTPTRANPSAMLAGRPPWAAATKRAPRRQRV